MSSDRRNKKIISYVICGAIILAIAVLGWLVMQNMDARQFTFWAALGLMFIASGVWELVRGPGPASDERSRKLNAFAARWSWQVAFGLTLALFIMEYLGFLGLSVWDVLLVLLAAEIVSAIASGIYYNLKGDVE